MREELRLLIVQGDRGVHQHLAWYTLAPERLAVWCNEVERFCAAADDDLVEYVLRSMQAARYLEGVSPELLEKLEEIERSVRRRERVAKP